MKQFKIVVCRGPECGERRDSSAVAAALVRAAEDAGVGDRIVFRWQSCFGRCTKGPNVLVRERTEPPSERRLATLPVGRGRSALYNGVAPSDARTVIDEHVLGGKIVRRLIIAEPKSAVESAPSLPLAGYTSRRTVDGDHE